MLLAGFYGWERFWTARDRETLVDLALIKVRSYVFGLSLGACFFAGFTSIFLVITLYLQVGLGYSALQAGATQTPFAVGLGGRRDRRRPADQPARPGGGGRRPAAGDHRAARPST